MYRRQHNNISEIVAMAIVIRVSEVNIKYMCFLFYYNLSEIEGTVCRWMRNTDLAKINSHNINPVQHTIDINVN